MSFKVYITVQIHWARSLRRHLHLRDNETALRIWAKEGYAKKFADKFRKEVKHP